MPDEFPSEGTLVVNATHQQEKRGWFDDGIVFSPTQIEEADLGFDIGVTSTTTGATEFGFQYKALMGEIGQRQFRQGESKVDALTFPFYPDQGVTLLFNAQHPRQMFYALPTITSQNQLRKTLDKTVFVDVFGLYSVIADYLDCRVRRLSAVDILAGLRAFSRVYVTKRSGERGGSNPAVFLKEKREGGAYADPRYYYEVPQRYVKSWDSIEALALAGFAGTPVARKGQQTPEYSRRLEYLATVDTLITELRSTDTPRITELSHEIRGILDSTPQRTPLVEGVRITDNVIQIGPPAADDVYTLGKAPKEDESVPTGSALVESIIATEVSREIEQIASQLESIIGEGKSPLAFEGSAHCHLLSSQL